MKSNNLLGNLFFSFAPWHLVPGQIICNALLRLFFHFGRLTAIKREKVDFDLTPSPSPPFTASHLIFEGTFTIPETRASVRLTSVLTAFVQ